MVVVITNYEIFKTFMYIVILSVVLYYIISMIYDSLVKSRKRYTTIEKTTKSIQKRLKRYNKRK